METVGSTHSTWKDAIENSFTADENSEAIFQLLVPASKREELIKYLQAITSGHLASEKTESA